MNRTNNSMNRHHGTRIDRRIVWLAGGLLLLSIIMFSAYFYSKTVTAQRSGNRMKLVTSIEIKKGDTLWTIAKSYMSEEYKDIPTYVEELKDSNGLISDTIHAGSHIIVPYYTDSADLYSSK